MSNNTIDQKVVEMRFDNRQFEANVSETLSTLEKLKRNLNNLNGSSKGLDNLSDAARKCDIGAVGDSAEKVGLKFNAMYTIADQALRNITNSAMTAGKRIISALTIDPVKMGFSEYETQIGAVQTILSNTKSKGTTLDQVNGALDELNTYADKTIYNFTEMTKNIGTFTAAGVDLDTSVSAIKGIANLAAVSGSTSQQASTAMYQLSQAMASGTVKLMDWNSVVNAGMGGQVFQDALKETAKVHGIKIDEIIKKQGSFRESLSDGWLTTEILTETLSKFTGDLTEEQLKSMGYTEEQIKGIQELGKDANDAATKVKTFTQLFDTLKEAAQSGWSQTWEIIIGDFEEAKEIFTKLSDTFSGIIGKSAESRNEMLENWKVMGGRDDMIESFKNVWEALLSIITPIKEAFRDIFPPMTSERLVEITANIKEFTSKLKLSDEFSDSLKRTFKGLFAVVDIGKQIFVAVAKAIGKLFGPVGKVIGGLFEVTAIIGDCLVAFADFIKSSNIFNVVLGTIADILGVVINIIASLIKFVARRFVAPGFEILRDILVVIGNYMKDVGLKAASMKDATVEAFSGMGEAVRNSSFAQFFTKVWDGIKKVASAIGKVVGGAFKKIGSAIGGLSFDSLVEFLKKLLSLASAFISTGIGLKIFSIVKNLSKGSKNLSEAFEGIKDIGNSVKGVIESITGVFESMQQRIKSQILETIAKAILKLAIACVILALIDADKLVIGLGAVTVLMVELVTAMKTMSSALDAKTMVSMRGLGIAIGKLATTLLILVFVIKLIKGMSLEEIAAGLLFIAAGLAVMTGAIAVLSKIEIKEDNIKKAATAMKKLAWALIPLALALKIMATMSWGEMARSLITMTVGLTAMVSALKVLNSGKSLDSSNLKESAVAIRKIAFAMLILSGALKIMATMSWGEMARGLIAMTVGLAAMTAALKVLNSGKSLDSAVFTKSAASIRKIAFAMVILSLALKIMATMSWGEMTRGLIAMTVGLAAMVTALKLLPSGSAVNSLGIVALSGAMVIFASTIWFISKLPWKAVVGGLLTMAAAFVVLGVAGKLLTPIAPVALKLAAALALMGVAVLAAGVGMIAFGVGLSAIATGFAAIGKALPVIMKGITGLIEAFIVGLIKGIGAGIVALCEVIIGAAGRIFEALVTLIETLCKAITKCVPIIAKAVLEMTLAVINALADYMPKIVEAAIRLIESIIQAIANAVGDIDFSSLVKAIAAVGIIAPMMKVLSQASRYALGAMKGVLLIGVVIAELALVLAAIGALAQIPGLKWIIDEGGELLASVGTAIGKLIGGVMGGIASGFTKSLPQIATDLSNFMTNLKPFIDGAKLLDPSMMDGVKTLVGVILALTAANVINSIAAWYTGGSSMTAFAKDLSKLGPCLRDYAESVSGLDTEAIKASATAAKSLAELANTIPNQGGVVSWFAGDNSIAVFGDELVSLGRGLKGFADETSGIVPENIIAAAGAAKSLAEMADTIPNQGGVVSWFAGDNSIAEFGEELVSLGKGLKGFSDATSGLTPENITAAAGAAKALAEMADTIPNEGGVVSWFAGDNSLSKFGGDIVALGHGLKGFSDATVGVVPENVIAAANAAKALAEMADTIPNEGGVVGWWTGENSLSKFGGDIVALGHGLKGFSDATTGIVPENIIAASNAAKALAEMSNTIPNEGGVVGWWTGENSLSKFSYEIIKLGHGLKGFSDATTGIVPENIVAAANAGKALAEMSSTIPNSNGVVALWSGDNSLSKFSYEIVKFGQGLKGFSDATMGIVPENVTAAANAGKTLAEMTHSIPESNGVVQWWAGEKSVSKFAGELPKLGEGLMGFSQAVVGLNPEAVTAAANAAKSLAEMTKNVPTVDGVAQWWAGEQSVSKFAGDLGSLGTGLKSFSDNTSGINVETVTAAANAAKSLAEMTESVPTVDGVAQWWAGEKSVSKFAGELPKLGEGLKGFSDKVAGVNPENLSASAKAAKSLAEMTQVVPDERGIKTWFYGETAISKFSGELPKLGEGLKGFSDSLEGVNPENISAAATAAKNLGEMADSAPEDTSHIVSFGTNLVTFGGSLKSYFTNTSGITADAISNTNKAVDAVKNVATVNSGSIQSLSTAIDKAVEALKKLSKVPKDCAASFTKALKDLGDSGADSLVKAFDNVDDDLKKAGQNAIDAFIKGVDGKKSAAKKACTDLASACADVMDDKKSSFATAGGYLVDGFAAGISENTYKAEAKARAMARAAADAANEELKINSPSKVFMETGAGVVEGFVKGVNDNESDSVGAVTNMAKDATKGFSNALRSINDNLANDMDMQPTIRPVLDLSDVRSGAGTINGLFGSVSSIGVLANVGAISLAMNKRNQNGAMDSVVSEIDKLNKNITGMDHATYIIDGVTFSGGSEVEEAFKTILRAAKIDRRT